MGPGGPGGAWGTTASTALAAQSNRPHDSPYVATAHVEQLADDGAAGGPNRLLKQRVHADADADPTPALYVPGEHATQPVDEPVLASHVPGTHNSQAAEPARRLKLPGAHATHAAADADPFTPFAVPAGHMAHAVAPFAAE